tara:strand:+ start:1243 stop:1506 length:264 start_codon:yes stop_codon:yes gene_type:complete
MTQLELIEMIRQHHPMILEAEVRAAMNRAQDDFSAKTETVPMKWEKPTVIDQRYYPLHPDMIKLEGVELNNCKIPRLIGRPGATDDE